MDWANSLQKKVNALNKKETEAKKDAARDAKHHDAKGAKEDTEWANGLQSQINKLNKEIKTVKNDAAKDTAAAKKYESQAKTHEAAAKAAQSK